MGGDDRGVERPKSLSTDTAASEALAEAEAVVLARIKMYAEKLGDREEDANLTPNLEALAELLDVLEGILELKAKLRAGS